MYTYEDLKPLSPWTYIWLTLLYTVPVLGLVFLIIHSLSRSASIEKRNFARSRLCLAALVILLICVLLLVLYLTGILLELNNTVTHIVSEYIEFSATFQS